MFTGIVQTTGTVAAIEPHGADTTLVVTHDGTALGALAAGDSVCVSGVCLTAKHPEPRRCDFDVSAETLGVTTLGTLQVGDTVNLEKAATLNTVLGGHLVSGHVDGMVVLETRAEEGRSVRLRFGLPPALARFVAIKGSVCIDGVSLTVNEVYAGGFGVNLVPHTLAVTTLGRRRPGERLNVEVDLLARYLDRLIQARDTPQPTGDP